MSDDNVIDLTEYRAVGPGGGGDIPPPKEQIAVDVMDGHGSMSAHGKYITSEDAYAIYIAMGGRSLRKTATMLGVPYGTVASWSRRGSWRQRVMDMDQELTEGVVHATAVAIVSQQLRTIEKLANIRDSPTSMDRDVINASKLLMEAYEKIRLSTTVSQLLSQDGGDMEADELEQLVQTPGGAQVLLGRLRQRTGRG